MYQYDSRELKEEDVFICLPKGDRFISQALQKKIKAYLLMTREQLGSFSNHIFKDPSSQLTVIGVTGTNGKTTVTKLVEESLRKLGYNPYVLGTLNAPLTTPESLTIIEIMKNHLDNGGTHFIMEVSSHAIDQNRIAGIKFDIKCLTNITQDHLDYHKTIEDYKNTKMKFMKAGNIVTILPEDYTHEEIPDNPNLKGEFNRNNLKAAMAILKQAKLVKTDNTAIINTLKTVSAPPGRFEVITASNKTQFDVIIDYAHTPDGLENILIEAKKLTQKTQGRVLTVFGCGGDRDRRKRPMMGEIAAKLSDYFIITQDNPRSEDINQITNDIKDGVKKHKTQYTIIDDREEAIKSIIKEASTGDIVIIAGKGHEDYQILSNKTIKFNDKEIAQKYL